MLQEEIIIETEFDPKKQETKFYQDPKTGEVITVPIDWEPETEITLTEKAIQLREEIAYQRGYKAGLEATGETHADEEFEAKGEKEKKKK